MSRLFSQTNTLLSQPWASNVVRYVQERELQSLPPIIDETIIDEIDYICTFAKEKDLLIPLMARALNEQDWKCFLAHYELRHEKPTGMTRVELQEWNKGVELYNRLVSYKKDLLNDALETRRQRIIAKGEAAFGSILKRIAGCK